MMSKSLDILVNKYPYSIANINNIINNLHKHKLRIIISSAKIYCSLLNLEDLSN